MKIKYTGKSNIRNIGEYSWNAGNDFIQDVTDTELAANLLTYPRPEFEMAEEVSKDVTAFINEVPAADPISFVEGEAALPKKSSRRLLRSIQNDNKESNDDNVRR